MSFSPSPCAAAPPYRVVLLGGQGLLGGAFRRAWADQSKFALREFTRAEVNLTRPEQIEQALEQVDFDLLVNAAAYTQVDDAEVQPDLAMAVNAQAPGLLAELCAARGARMVHFSTDYVFDGLQSQPYREGDAAAPLSAYGRSKWVGEQRVAAASSQHLILRLAWLFGPGSRLAGTARCGWFRTKRGRPPTARTFPGGWRPCWGAARRRGFFTWSTARPAAGWTMRRGFWMRPRRWVGRCAAGARLPCPWPAWRA